MLFCSGTRKIILLVVNQLSLRKAILIGCLLILLTLIVIILILWIILLSKDKWLSRLVSPVPLFLIWNICGLTFPLSQIFLNKLLVKVFLGHILFNFGLDCDLGDIPPLFEAFPDLIAQFFTVFRVYVFNQFKLESYGLQRRKSPFENIFRFMDLNWSISWKAFFFDFDIVLVNFRNHNVLVLDLSFNSRYDDLVSNDTREQKVAHT